MYIIIIILLLHPEHSEKSLEYFNMNERGLLTSYELSFLLYENLNRTLLAKNC